jgi:hypothetical protein
MPPPGHPDEPPEDLFARFGPPLTLDEIMGIGDANKTDLCEAIQLEGPVAVEP